MNFLTQQRAHPGAHFAGSGHRVGEGENLLGLGVSLLDKLGNTVNQDRGFPCAGTSQNQHWPADVLDRPALAVIGTKWRGMRLRLGDSHRGSEYHSVRQRAENESGQTQNENSLETAIAVAAMAAG